MIITIDFSDNPEEFTPKKFVWEHRVWKIEGDSLSQRDVWFMNTIQDVYREYKKRSDAALKNVTSEKNNITTTKENNNV